MIEQVEDLKQESEARKSAKMARDFEVSRLASAGLSSGRIAAKIGEKSGTVLAIMKRLGIPRGGKLA